MAISRFLQLEKVGRWMLRYTAACDGFSRLMMMGAIVGFIRPALNSSNVETQMQVGCVLAALAFYVAPSLGGLLVADDDRPTDEEELAALRLIIREAVGNESQVHRIVREVIAKMQQEQQEECNTSTPS